MTSAPSLRRVLVAGVLLLIAVVTAGCSPDQWGTAAQVGDQRISADDLQRDTADVRKSFDFGTGNPSEIQSNVLNSLIVMQLADIVSAKYNVVVPDAEIAATRASVLGQPDWEASIAQQYLPPSQLDGLIKERIQGSKLNELLVQKNQNWALDELTAAAESAKVYVNPRYGSFSIGGDTPLQILPPTGGGLSSSQPIPVGSGTPAPSPTAVPAPEVGQ